MTHRLPISRILLWIRTDSASLHSCLESKVSLVPIDVGHDLLDVLGFSVLVINVKCMVAGIDDDDRHCHPEYPHRVIVADDILEFAIDRVLDQHRPASGFRSRAATLTSA